MLRELGYDPDGIAREDMGPWGYTDGLVSYDWSNKGDWEKIRVQSLGGDLYALKTVSGNYITAVGGGGRTTDVLHTDATRIGAWEKFRLNC